MVFEPDGITPTTEVRVCREEAQASETGHIYASGARASQAAGAHARPPPSPRPAGAVHRATPGREAPAAPDRLRPPPGDDGYAKQHKGEEVSCRGAVGASMTVDCGCGVGLEHCLPGDGFGQDPRAFSFPTHIPLGLDLPFAAGPQNASSWNKLWWSQEAQALLPPPLRRATATSARCSRAAGRHVNGPLAQFYTLGRARRAAAAASAPSS